MHTWRIARPFVLCCTLLLASWPAFAVNSDALPRSAAKALDADKVCTSCHDSSYPEPVLDIYQTPHGVTGDPKTPLCQSCHGDSKKHIQDASVPPDVVFGDRATVKGIKGRQMIFKPSAPSVQNKECLSCHEGGLRTHWVGSQHQVNGLACATCHSVHLPKDPILTRANQREICFDCHKEQQADSHKFSTHPLDAGKIVCSDCHNPHGSTGPKLLKKNTVNEVCWQCHADKRGPFLWEHQPVTEDCTNCHTPHGSNISPLLKDRPPFLCEDCHNGPHQSSDAIGPGLTGSAPNAPGRACLNCHVMIHGSNSPAGAFLHR
ncbi:MAG TPA: DmsE family decaheme c-type cytochrome [Parasulfuritortus sp.]